MEDKDEDSGSWKLGMGIVAAGLLVIMSVGATSAGYYGEQKLNEKNSRIIIVRSRGLLGPHQRNRRGANLLRLRLI